MGPYSGKSCFESFRRYGHKRLRQSQRVKRGGSYRVEEVGYSWSTVGENISAGREDSEEVVAAWLLSPHHCENIMRQSFTEIGATCFHNKDTKV